MKIILVYDLIDWSFFVIAAALISLDVVLDVDNAGVLVLKDSWVVDESVVLCGDVHDGLAWWEFLVDGGTHVLLAQALWLNHVQPWLIIWLCWGITNCQLLDLHIRMVPLPVARPVLPCRYATHGTDLVLVCSWHWLIGDLVALILL